MQMKLRKKKKEENLRHAERREEDYIICNFVLTKELKKCERLQTLRDEDKQLAG